MLVVELEGDDVDDPADATLPNTFSKKSPSPSLDLEGLTLLLRLAVMVVLVLPPNDMATVVSLLFNRRLFLPFYTGIQQMTRADISL
uniref:Uncharacterized protein n=1 Tax=Solanum tuberosum TaxID=4113 RepID=M1C5Q8_SOLTU